jgi:hypothetical protein
MQAAWRAAVNDLTEGCMGTFYSDEQIEEAIAELEKFSPGIWETILRMAVVRDRLTEDQEITLTAITRAMTIVMPRVSFVAGAENKFEAENRLIIDVGNAVRAAIDAAKGGSSSAPLGESG